jgi:glycosyltransferase involved in cell wall biosynthesis
MAKKKVTYILSHINKALAFEWIAEELNKDQFELSFILLNEGNSYIEQFLREKQIPVFRVEYAGKKHLWRAFWQVRKLLKKLGAEVVHAHLFDANIVGLSAAKSLGIKKRIYTRHHSTLHFTYFPRAVYYDKFVNWLATDIIAISEVVRRVIVDREKSSPAKVHLVPHGFRLEEFEKVTPERVQLLRDKYKLTHKPIVGIIARHIHWKGIQYIIPAFAKVLETYPQAHLLLANANGDYKPELQKLLDTLPKGSYTEIAFEQDLYALYQLLDVYVHAPINPDLEAFGQTYVEALAAGIPSVFTLSGIAHDFIVDEKNALVVPYQNSEAVTVAIKRILEDDTLRQNLIRQGKESVRPRFELQNMIQSLENLYK